MKNKLNLVVYGLMSLVLVAGIMLLVKSVNQVQDNRSNSTGEEGITQEETIDGICGSTNGQIVEIIPEGKGACEVGAINWLDPEGLDGAYNWLCIGTMNGQQDECVATIIGL